MNDTQIKELLQEIKNEQHPIETDDTINGYIKDAAGDINESSGCDIDYKCDTVAKSLLKNYVFYARYKRLAEFKQLYGGEYAYLQAKYYKPTSV